MNHLQTSISTPALSLPQPPQQLDSEGNNETPFKAVSTPDVKAADDGIKSWPRIPFAKTFDFSESYRKNSEKGGNSLLTTQHRPPQRRRCRSNEGMMLRLWREEDTVDAATERTAASSDSTPPLPYQKLNFESELRRRKVQSNQSPEASSGRKRHNQHRRSPSNNLQQQRQERRWWIIPVEHSFKVIWDVLTVILSILHSYLTHLAIRDRNFGPTPFITFCDTWFLVDILLNFVTERRTAKGEILRDPRSICARYLTSWFAVDALALFPWESLYMQPLIDLQNRRGFFKKSFFRSKAIVRVTRHLRGKHFRWFGTVAKHTKQHGVGANRLLRLIIKYVPKYFMFLRNMKGIVAMRVLRFVHWVRRFITNMEGSKAGQHFNSDASTRSMTTREEDDLLQDDISSCASHQNGDGKDSKDRGNNIRDGRSKSSRFQKPVEFIYEAEDWEVIDDDDDDDEEEDDDGVPL